MMFVSEADVGTVDTQMLIIIILACVGALDILLIVVGVICAVGWRSVHFPVYISNTKNTFCGTLYLPHSRVHKSMAELCSNFGDSPITKGQIAYFSCACAKRLYFYLQSKI